MESKKTVLVVEDERPLQEVIQKKLELSGFEVISARTVNQALEYIKDMGSIDVIWLDHYLLGKENGLDFVVKLKTHEQWQTIPIVVVSNTASPDKVLSYISLGVNKYYTKSDFRLDQIIEHITDVLTKIE